MRVRMHGTQQESELAVVDGVRDEGRDLAAVQSRHLVVVALDVSACVKAGTVEGTRGAQVHRTADAAFERGGFRRLEHIGTRDHLGGQHVEGQIAAVVVGGENAVVERDDIVLRPEAAHGDLLPFTTGGAVDGDARQMLQRVGNVGIRETAQFLGVDGIQNHGGILFDDLSDFSKLARNPRDDDFLQLRVGTPLCPAAGPAAAEPAAVVSAVEVSAAAAGRAPIPHAHGKPHPRST